MHTRLCLCPPRVCFPVLCKFWHIYGGVNGDLLQEGLCHTQACCTQSTRPCGSPLLTRTSTGDALTQFCLSLCGVPGSWCSQGLFEPSEHLWQVWGLILNVILSLLPFCWGFSFFLGRGVSPQSPSSAAQLPLQCLPSCWGFSAFGHGASCHSLSSTTQLLLSPLVTVQTVFHRTPVSCGILIALTQKGTDTLPEMMSILSFNIYLIFFFYQLNGSFE